MDMLTFVRNLSDEASKLTDLFAPQWEARKDVAKVIVSITSAAHIFALTFSEAFFKREASSCWRFLFIVCWIGLAASLNLSLLFLYFSINLHDLPARIQSKFKDFAKPAKSNPDTEPIHTVFDTEFEYICRRDRLCTRLFHASLVCFAMALLVFTVVGVRQLTLR